MLTIAKEHYPASVHKNIQMSLFHSFNIAKKEKNSNNNSPDKVSFLVYTLHAKLCHQVGITTKKKLFMYKRN